MTIKFSATTAGLAKIRREKPAEFAQALHEETLVEEKECQRECPVKTGNLRSTIHTEGPVIKGRNIQCFIVAGGSQAPYAWHVHEDVEAFHPHGGNAKYIEGPLKQSASSFPQRIAERMKKNGSR